MDDAASTVLNRAARDWHADFFAEIQAKGSTAVGTFSMEFVDPLDSPPSKVWAARYLDGQAVLTATGFANLNSTHCIFSSDVLPYQKKMLRPLAEQCRHHRNAVGVRGQLSARQLHRRKQEVMESPRQAARRAGRDSTGPTHDHRGRGCPPHIFHWVLLLHDATVAD